MLLHVVPGRPGDSIGCRAAGGGKAEGDGKDSTSAAAEGGKTCLNMELLVVVSDALDVAAWLQTYI